MAARKKSKTAFQWYDMNSKQLIIGDKPVPVKQRKTVRGVKANRDRS